LVWPVLNCSVLAPASHDADQITDFRDGGAADLLRAGDRLLSPRTAQTAGDWKAPVYPPRKWQVHKSITMRLLLAGTSAVRKENSTYALWRSNGRAYHDG
jgi:hypothetical protein